MRATHCLLFYAQVHITRHKESTMKQNEIINILTKLISIEFGS
ncbi:hypothetical protein HMPREF3230_00004 [Gardnerella vaginalis]|uniref:Uncharacterized protein n=1 Tax=Gardnerella vaginalis TaxID=2702 RepID=A0A135ZCC6_GARVA|nr:hypothetical protein HMPREF3230_00004 [Gardnerella vaginalis]